MVLEAAHLRKITKLNQKMQQLVVHFVGYFMPIFLFDYHAVTRQFCAKGRCIQRIRFLLNILIE